MKFDLVFSNKSSALNKKLIKFFQLNLLSLNKTSLVFNFEVAHPEDVDKYIKRGIKNYPILILDNKSVTGVEKIITYLKALVDKHNKKILNKTDDDKINDFWKDTINNGDEDDEDGNDENIHKKIQDAFEQRNDTTNPVKQNTSLPNNIQTSISKPTDEKPSDTLKKMKGGNMDDELMAKFFENQGEGLSE